MYTSHRYNFNSKNIIIFHTTDTSISRLQPGPMQGILRGLLEGLVQATSGQQLSRAYLYGALLYYLQLTSEQTADQFTGNHYVAVITVYATLYTPVVCLL